MNSTELQALASAQGITLDPSLLIEYPIGTWFWCIHHQIIAEQLNEPLANRIEFILTQKDVSERKIRLDALRPVKNPIAVAAAYETCNEVEAPLRKAYVEVRGAAWKAYSEAMKIITFVRDGAMAKGELAWGVYYNAVDDAQEVRNKVCTSAWETFVDAATPAWKAYSEAIAPQWLTEYPDHPAWNETGLVFL